MFICAHVFGLRHLLKKLPNDVDMMVAQWQWVLVQVLPPSLPFLGDIFATIINSLHSATYAAMLNLAHFMLQEMMKIMRNKIFPQKLLFAVFNEAQVAAVYLKDSFVSSPPGIDMCPVLHAFYMFLWDTRIFQGVILARTSLSMKRIQRPLFPQATKLLSSHPIPIVFTEIGRFMKNGTDHHCGPGMVVIFTI